MNKLEEICRVKRDHIAQQKRKFSANQLEDMARNDATPPRAFIKALLKKQKSGQFGLIAEIKKASPSKGLIRADFSPLELAKAYEEGGAACLSILTDIPYFQGTDEYLKAARDVTTLPVLRKDFMLDPYQVTESRALGADCILLIMAALSDSQAAELEATAFEYDMDVLVEIHDMKEGERALKTLKSKLLGVNNRSLKSLEVDLETAKSLAKLIPDDYLKVCESGISSHDDLLQMKDFGYNSFLVGESLMRQNDVKMATQKLLGITAA